MECLEISRKDKGKCKTNKTKKIIGLKYFTKTRQGTDKSLPKASFDWLFCCSTPQR